MHISVIVYNIGGYHAARLRAAHTACAERGWRLSAIEIAGTTAEHPWGQICKPDFVKTLSDFEPGVTPTQKYGKVIERLLEACQPDAVAIPGWGFDYSRAALRWTLRNRRIRILMSESKFDDAPRVWYREWIKSNRYVKKFDAALVGGSLHIDYLKKLGMPAHRIFTGYDVVDNDFFIQETDRIRTIGNRQVDMPTRPFFLSSNRFILRKNLALLIHAYAEYLQVQEQAKSKWDLVLLGDGPLRGELETLTRQLQLTDRIHFPGFVDYQHICDWYANAGAFVHPALSEQWGLVVNEAMAAQLPVLVSEVAGCAPDLVTSGVGYTFNPNHQASLSELLQRVAMESCSQHMGVSARRHIVENHSVQNFGKGLVAAIAKVRD
jgi:1,2-diacylglycerol 3-alpha-glucosyltransferase